MSINGFGLGLRPEHYDEILKGPVAVDWFEAITDNYLVPGGKPLHFLQRIRERFELVLHGVSLSIGSVDPPDPHYLAEEPLDPPNIFLCTVVTILALWGLRRLWNKDPHRAVFLGLLLLVFPLVFYVTHPEVYVRRQIDPIVVLLAVYGAIGRGKGEEELRAAGGGLGLG